MPVVGGNVSLYNETERGPIYPTPVVGMVGELPSLGGRRRRRCREGDAIVFAGPFAPALAGSQLAKLRAELAPGLGAFEIGAVKAAIAEVREAVRAGRSTPPTTSATAGSLRTRRVRDRRRRRPAGRSRAAARRDRPQAWLFGEGPGGFVLAGEVTAVERLVGGRHRHPDRHRRRAGHPDRRRPTQRRRARRRCRRRLELARAAHGGGARVSVTALAIATKSRNLLLARPHGPDRRRLRGRDRPAGRGGRHGLLGPLQADTGSSRWRLSFQDRRGHRVLTEDAGRGTGPAGTLGFRDGSVWRHATRIIGERRHGTGVAATLATNDPLGRRIEVVLTPQRPGVIRLRASLSGLSTTATGVTALGIGFDARAGERYLGFGERSNAVDQRGNDVESYVGEGPYPDDERPLIAAFVPAVGLPAARRRDLLPGPVAALDRAATACSSTTTETSYFRLGSDGRDAWSVEVERATRCGPRCVFAGPDPADALRRFTARHRPPAARRRARGTSAPGFSPPATTSAERRGAAERRRPGLASARPTRTTCRAATTRPPRRARARPPASTPRAGRSPPTSTR